MVSHSNSTDTPAPGKPGSDSPVIDATVVDKSLLNEPLLDESPLDEPLLKEPLLNEPLFELAVINSPIGKLKLIFQSGQLASVEFDTPAELEPPKTGAAKSLCRQLENYFSCAGSAFHFPVVPQGSGFQKRVWRFLQQIPIGKVLTYGDAAKALNSSARAVGSACRRNPTPIVVPCHRIVSAKGIGGFAGQTEGKLTEIKRTLLRHEGIEIE